MKNKKLLMIVLFAAVFLTLWMINLEGEYKEVTLYPGEEEVSGLLEDSTNLGDMELDGTFFAEYRIKRDRVRSQEVEMLKDLINNPETSQEAKEKGEQKLLDLVDRMETELMIENMIKGEGFEDAVSFYKEGICNLVVKTDQLTEAQFMQVVEATSRVTGENIENIMVTANK